MQSFRDRVCDDFSPASCGEFVKQMLDTEHTTAIYRDGEVGGLVWLPRISPIVAFSHVIFSRPLWGREKTLTATRSIYAAAFETGVEKICSSAFADNHQVHTFAKALGYVAEGHRRKQTRRRGVLVDMIDYGLLKEEFYANWNTSRDVVDGSAERGSLGSGRPDKPQEDNDQQPDLDPATGGDAEAGR
jgi:hypothetical protein